MAAFLGGIRIDSAAWLGARTLVVRFTSVYGAAFHYQLYAGRCRIGVTASKRQRRIAGELTPSAWPQHLTLAAVDPADRLKDFGTALPPRPYNRVRLKFSTSAWPDDAEHIDVVRGDEPGGAVNPETLVERLLYDTDRQYTVDSDPLPGSGDWNFEVFGRDSRRPDGNAGSKLAASQAVLAHPPDVALAGDGTRLSASVADQTATVSFTYPTL